MEATLEDFPYKALGDSVIVKRNTLTNKRKSGIIIPDITNKVDNSGIVVKIGPGRTLPNGQRVVADVKVGDRVLFSSYSIRNLGPLTDNHGFVQINDASTVGILGILTEDLDVKV